eukprot:TRINITY_DN49523_c0_g1_i1.p1 TRINITY_DN49523_c0_g1~~TRINITY_DN49523_c0_g1_i1.p1  ORF type:complete len:169 (-),score=24.56 TRINITY_DN49523_c0_g1_i1:46-552(-)
MPADNKKSQEASKQQKEEKKKFFNKRQRSVKDRAITALANSKKGHHRGVTKVRTSPTFKRPKTLNTPSKPLYPRKAQFRRPTMDAFQVIQHPYTSETAMKKMEDHNTLVFIVDLKANKYQIKEAFKKLYKAKAKKVRTLITPQGKKKAFVRLVADNDALDVANKIGII